MAYTIAFEPDALDHLQHLRAHERTTVLDEVEANLTGEPGVETRNRKFLRPNPLAPWELRIGDLRVFYDIDEPARQVRVNAVGVKRGNRLIIGGEEVVL